MIKISFKNIVYGATLSSLLFSCKGEDIVDNHKISYEQPNQPSVEELNTDPIREGKSLLEVSLPYFNPLKINCIFKDKTDFRTFDSNGNITLDLKYADFYEADLPNTFSNTTLSPDRDQKVAEWRDSEAGQERVQYFKDFLEKDMVFVQGGTYLMGGTSEQGENVHPTMFPVHKVTVGDFYMCRFELTQEFYSYVIGKWYRWNFTDGVHKNFPADNRTLKPMYDLFNSLKSITGLQFDFPTEAEWEWAARGGRKSKEATMYSGSNDYVSVAATFDECFRELINALNAKSLKTWPLPVGTKEPNELGIYDMSGNIAEFCKDEFKPYTAEDQVDPGKDIDIRDEFAVYDPNNPDRITDVQDQLIRVIRGGGYGSLPSSCRVAVRGGVNLLKYNTNIGFRLVCRVSDNKEAFGLE